MGQVTWWSIAQWLGLPTLGAALALGVVRFVGKGWIKSLFNKDLEQFKSEQQQKIEAYKADQSAKIEAFRASQTDKIERLKGDINTSIDRASRLHEVQFIVYPEVWRLAQEAVYATGDLIALIRWGGGIGGLTLQQRSELYGKKGFSDGEQELIEKQIDAGPMQGQSAYNLVEDQHRASTAASSYNAFNKYLREKGIFIAPDLRDRLHSLATMMREALGEHEDDRAGDMEGLKSAERRLKRNALNKQWDSIRVEIENDFYTRLAESNLIANPSARPEELPQQDAM